MRFHFARAIPAPRPYRGLARIVFLRPYRLRKRFLFRDLRKQIPVPLGWLMLTMPNMDCVIVGPWWVLGWPWVKCQYWWRICEWALKHGWAKEPYEGCYLNELRWFPKLRRRSRAT